MQQNTAKSPELLARSLFHLVNTHIP